MKVLFKIFLFVALIFNQSITKAQTFDPDSLVGDYAGIWTNTTFSSSGDASLEVSFNQSNSSMQFILDLDGFVGGLPDPDPRTLNGTYNSTGAAIDSSGSEGDLILTWDADAIIKYDVTNITTPGFATQGGTGIGTGDVIMLDYYVEFSFGDSAFGTVEMFKQPPTSVDDVVNSDDPFSYKLYKNYPNPFNPSTNIFFSIPEDAEVKIIVYNNMGEQIAELVNKYFTKGTHNAVFNAANLPSGVYYYKMDANSYSKTNKMILLK
ncbi:MAG: T9SS type A sorting domain-containing protein [Ignavibacteriaceae bacterium]